MLCQVERLLSLTCPNLGSQVQLPDLYPLAVIDSAFFNQGELKVEPTAVVYNSSTRLPTPYPDGITGLQKHDLVRCVIL